MKKKGDGLVIFAIYGLVGIVALLVIMIVVLIKRSKNPNNWDEVKYLFEEFRIQRSLSRKILGLTEEERKDHELVGEIARQCACERTLSDLRQEGQEKREAEIARFREFAAELVVALSPKGKEDIKRLLRLCFDVTRWNNEAYVLSLICRTRNHDPNDKDGYYRGNSPFEQILKETAFRWEKKAISDTQFVRFAVKWLEMAIRTGDEATTFEAVPLVDILSEIKKEALEKYREIIINDILKWQNEGNSLDSFDSNLYNGEAKEMLYFFLSEWEVRALFQEQIDCIAKDYHEWVEKHSTQI